MRRIFIAILLAASLIVTFSVPSRADVVSLKSGDRLTGSIVKLHAGRLHLETGYAKKNLVFNRDTIESIATDQPVDVLLQSGESFMAAIRGFPEGPALTLHLQDGSQRELELDQIASINPPSSRPTFTGDIGIGGTYQSGNTDRSAANTNINAVWKHRRHRYTFGLTYNYAEESDIVTERDTFAHLKYDYFFSRRFYVYLDTELLHDKFKDIDLRTAIGPGIGYQAWDDDRKSLSFEVGLTYYHEDRINTENDEWMTARLSSLLTWTFDSGLKFSENLTVYPDLEESGELTLRNEASLTAPLAFGWSLQLRNVIEYDSDPPSQDIETTDRSWILSMNYSF